MEKSIYLFNRYDDTFIYYIYIITWHFYGGKYGDCTYSKENDHCILGHKICFLLP